MERDRYRSRERSWKEFYSVFYSQFPGKKHRALGRTTREALGLVRRRERK